MELPQCFGLFRITLVLFVINKYDNHSMQADQVPHRLVPESAEVVCSAVPAEEGRQVPALHQAYATA